MLYCRKVEVTERFKHEKRRILYNKEKSLFFTLLNVIKSLFALKSIKNNNYAMILIII